MKVKRMRISTATRQASGTHRPEPTSEHWIFSTTRCSTDERFASSRSLISEVARVGLEANFRLSGRCVGQALDRLAAQREWPNVISWTTAWSSRPRSWSSGQCQGVKLDHTPPGKLP
jgi:putative transposase